MTNATPFTLFSLRKLIHVIFSRAKQKVNRMATTNVQNKAIMISGLLIMSVSVVALFINFYYLHYIGNNYFPPNSMSVGLTLALILTGTYLQWNAKHVTFIVVRELLFFYLVMVVIVLITNASQYTPFKPVDDVIIYLESSAQLDMTQLMAWTARQPYLKNILRIAYASLEYQMAFLPLFMIATLNLNRVRSYYFFLLSTAFIGFVLYYFFPTTAPASNLYSPFFIEEQRATGIKFNEIHHHLTPTTIAGGLIALPSFHVIWAWGCLYLTHGYRWLFALLLPLNCMLLASCVLLGWHYPLDLLGAAFVILLTHVLQGQFKKL